LAWAWRGNPPAFSLLLDCYEQRDFYAGLIDFLCMPLGQWSVLFFFTFWVWTLPVAEGRVLINIYMLCQDTSRLERRGLPATRWWGMGLTRDQWVAIGRRRILSILARHRVSYSKHLEIKISEAGPRNMRVEPALLNQAFRQLKKEKALPILQVGQFEVVGAPDFGRPGDKAKLGKFNRLHELFLDCSQISHLCGWQLEHFIYEAALNHSAKQYMILGAGPTYVDGQLFKHPHSEQNFYMGRQSYGGAGLDLFFQYNHQSEIIPVGVEAKNVRDWIYPASVEVWRMIARACTLECLPVMAARKISYITTAGFFSQFGILGFQTHFQYFNPAVRAFSKYNFKDVVAKDGLGFADIKITDKLPQHFKHFFNDILPKEIKPYYDKFMSNRDLLMKYAIEYKMAEDIYSASDRMRLYAEFKDEAAFEDPDFESPDDDGDLIVLDD
jgi:hypothetical protein